MVDNKINHRDDEESEEKGQDKTRLTDSHEAAAPAREGVDFAPGAVVGGDYEVISLIGAGGMGNVYQVRHLILQKRYALKTLSAQQVTEVAWKRFQNEAQAIARMSHPNIVGIHNLGLHNGELPYYVMDFLPGKTLKEILEERGPLPVTEVLKIFIEICNGLTYAHKKGIIHRDIKPPNIVLVDNPEGDGGRVKIVDFGIAKLVNTKELATQQLTGVGEICGSPIYMSPEQCEAGLIDERSDVYSLGCTMFEALTGGPPFKGRNGMETMMMHANNRAPTLSAATAGKAFPPALEAVIAHALAKNPGDRYQNMENFAADLQDILTSPNDIAVGTFARAKSEKKNSADKYVRDKNSREAPVLGAVALVIIGIGVYIMADSRTPSVKNATAVQPVVGQPAAIARPFSSIEKGDDGKEYRVFDFTGAENFGLLGMVGDRLSVVPTSDRRKYPKEAQLRFMFNEACFVRPENLERFRPDDLYELDCSQIPFTDIRPTNAVFKHIVHLKSVRNLTLMDCTWLDDGALPYLNQLPNVTKLDMEFVHITPEGLARGPLLKHLRTLVIESTMSLTPIFRALSGSTEMRNLTIQEKKLNAEEYGYISNLPNLEYLNLMACETSDQDLQIISKLKNLRVLNLGGSRLTTASVPTLKKMHSQGLLEVHMLSAMIPQAERMKIEHAGTGLAFK